MLRMIDNHEGRLKPDLSSMDVLRATLPAGTGSGAPKVRAAGMVQARIQGEAWTE